VSIKDNRTEQEGRWKIQSDGSELVRLSGGRGGGQKRQGFGAADTVDVLPNHLFSA
jgi:hypothetical protein